MAAFRRKPSQAASVISVPASEDMVTIDELLSAREFERRAFATPHLSRSRRQSHELETILAPGWTSKEARAFYCTEKSMWAGEVNNRYDNIWAYDRTAVRLPMYPRDWNRSKIEAEGLIQKLVKDGKRKDHPSGYLGYLNANVCRDQKGSWWVISQAPLPEGFHPFFLSILLTVPTIEYQRAYGTNSLRATLSRQTSETSLRSLTTPSPSAVVSRENSFNFSLASLSLRRKKSTDKIIKQERHAIIVQLADCVENGLIKADPYLPENYMDPITYSPPELLKRCHPSITLKLTLQQAKPSLSSTYSVCTLTCAPIPTPPPRPASTPHPRLASRYNSFSSETGEDPTPERSARQSHNSSETASIASGMSGVYDKTSPMTTSSTSLKTLHPDTEPSTIPEQPEPMTIHHLSYHAWPDHGVPKGGDVAALRRLIDEVGRMQRNFGCEVWVHCSAGVGRSGTFVALSSLLLPAQNHPTISPLPPMNPSPLAPLPKDVQGDKVVETIDMLRDQRSWLCERREQIELIYDVFAGRDGR